MKAEDAQLRAAVEALPQQFAKALLDVTRTGDNSIVTAPLFEGALGENGIDNSRLTTMSKLELAQWWLEQNPEHKSKSDRWLENNAKPADQKISRTWWNRAKK